MSARVSASFPDAFLIVTFTRLKFDEDPFKIREQNCKNLFLQHKKNQMKNIIALILTMFTVQAIAQKITYHYDDTLRTTDVNDPGREYIAIYNHKGNITSQGTLQNGKREGMWRTYANGNGMLSQVSEYKNGIINGANILFGTNGMVLTDETFKDNKLNGTRTTMNNMGRVKTVETYTDGILNGSKKTFYEDGKPQEEGFWKNGQRDGLTRWFNAKGVVSLEYTYSNGILQGETREYNEKGRVQRVGIYDKNNEQGEWLEFADDSVLVKKTIFEKGNIVKEIQVKK